MSMRRLLKIPAYTESGGHRSGACATEIVWYWRYVNACLSEGDWSARDCCNTSSRGHACIVKKQVWILTSPTCLTMSVQVTLVVRLPTKPQKVGLKSYAVNLAAKLPNRGMLR